MGLTSDWYLEIGNVALDTQRRSLPHPVDHDPAFARPMERALQRIRESEVGGVVLRSMRPRAVISAWSNADNDRPGMTGHGEAFTVWGYTVDAFAAGARVRDSGDPPRPTGEIGTGRGCWAATYIHVDECAAQPEGIDGILVHELTHALRITHGAMTQETVRQAPRTRTMYTHAEEQMAMLVLDMYLSEQGRAPTLVYTAETEGRVERTLPLGPRRHRIGKRAAYQRRADLARWQLRAVEDFVGRALTLRVVFERFARLDYDGYNPFRDYLHGGDHTVMAPREWTR